MSRTHRSSARILRDEEMVLDAFLFEIDDDLDHLPGLVPVDHQTASPGTRWMLESVLRAHRWQLVATARHHLRNGPHDAEDVVQDVCVDVLEGRTELRMDPEGAYADMLRAVIERCKSGAY